MASLTIIPYNPIQANAYCSSYRSRTKGIFKPISHHELRIKPSILPVDTPQPQEIAVADGVGGLTMHEKDSDSISDGNHYSPERQGSHDSACTGQGRDQACSQESMDKGAPIIMSGSEKVSSAENNDIQIEIDSLFGGTDDIFEPKNTLMTEVDDILAEADAESKVGGAEIQDSNAEFGTDDIGSGMRDIETIQHPLKRKAKTGRQGSQGSQDNPLVIPDSDTESENDSESEDGLLWKKQRVSHSLVGRRQVRSWWRMIDETDNEANETEFEIGSTRVRAGDAQSENDGKGNRQSHPRPAASSTHHSDFDSALFKSADRIESQSVARVGGNGEWGIHGIIGKEVIEGKVYYCVDWEPTMMPLDELCGAERLVREFEAKEQAQQRKMGRTQKKKHRGRCRKQK